MADELAEPEGPSMTELLGPPDANRQIMPTMSFGLSVGQAASAQQVLAGKLTEGQIDKLVEQGKADKKYQHDERMANIGVNKLLIVVGAIATVVVALGFLYYGKPELLKDIAVLIVGAIGGFSAGRVSSPKPDNMSALKP